MPRDSRNDVLHQRLESIDRQLAALPTTGLASVGRLALEREREVIVNKLHRFEREDVHYPIANKGRPRRK